MNSSDFRVIRSVSGNDRPYADVVYEYKVIDIDGQFTESEVLEYCKTTLHYCKSQKNDYDRFFLADYYQFEPSPMLEGTYYYTVTSPTKD